MELDGLGALSNALVCRCRHDRVSVVAEKKVLFYSTDAERAATVVQLFEEVKAAERVVFGMKSYCLRLEHGLPSDPDTWDDVRPVIHGFEEPEVESEAEDVTMEGTGL